MPYGETHFNQKGPAMRTKIYYTFGYALGFLVGSTFPFGRRKKK